MISIHTDVAYRHTPQRTLLLDMRVPKVSGGSLPPLVVYIPVLGMRVCARAGTPWWLSECGFAMATIEARLSSEAIAPATVHDCKAAVRWLRAHAGEYGYCGQAIGVWGHSAGGLLSALLATSGDDPALAGDGEHLEVSAQVQAACDQCGAPHDFAYFARPDVKARFAPVAENVRLYLGGDADQRPQLARLVSPRTYVSPQCPPMLLIHGDRDDVVPLEETMEFHQALLAAGVDAMLRVLPGVGHNWDPALTRDPIEAFFTRTLKR